MDKLSERLEAEAATWPIDAVSGGPHKLRLLLTEAAKLARRVEEAPATVLVCCHADDGVELVAQVPSDSPGTWCSGQRVRLVREE